MKIDYSKLQVEKIEWLCKHYERRCKSRNLRAYEYNDFIGILKCANNNGILSPDQYEHYKSRVDALCFIPMVQ